MSAFMAGQGERAGSIAYQEGESPTLKAEASGTNQVPSIIGTGAASDRCAFDPKPDSSRYAACGDAVTVSVSYWIGCRLRDFA